MSQPVTESLHPAAAGLDALPGGEVLALLLAAQVAAVQAVAAALPQIEAGAQLMADTLRGSGRLVFAGAGSSALMANADGMELPGTFGVDPARIVLSMAGGIPTDAHMPGDSEDDAGLGARAGAQFGPGDLVIAVTASGRTPYPLELARAARSRGARVVAMANNAGAPLFDHADVAICLPTPPEMLAGSTRMGAGTAQKVALNMMSTLMGIKLGQVYDGMMVALVADNAKLRARAVAVLCQITGADAILATRSLASATGAVKPAALIALGASPAFAAQLLSETEGNLRAALARLKTAGSASRKNISNQGSQP